MYYSEKLIEGIWHFKNSPNAEYKSMTIWMLNRKINQLINKTK